MNCLLFGYVYMRTSLRCVFLCNVVLLLDIPLFEDVIDPMTKICNIRIDARDCIEAANAPSYFTSHIVLAVFIVWNFAVERCSTITFAGVYSGLATLYQGKEEEKVQLKPNQTKAIHDTYRAYIPAHINDA